MADAIAAAGRALPSVWTSRDRKGAVWTGVSSNADRSLTVAARSESRSMGAGEFIRVWSDEQCQA